jgi:hypothetical protein
VDQFYAATWSLFTLRLTAFIWSHCAELRIATFTLISPWENFGKWVNDNFPGLSFTINDKEIAVS